MRFVKVHSSGRFDEAAHAFRLAVLAYMAICQALSVTEVDRDARARELQPPGWNGTWGDKGPRDDCGIATEKAAFTLVHEETYTLSHRRYVNERGETADTTEAAFQVVRDRHGDLGLLGSIHTPHEHKVLADQLRTGHVHTDVALAYVDIVRGYFRRARELMHEHDIKYAALSGDWNLDFRQAWVRAWFAKNHPAWTLNWDPKHLPAKGTHGHELIDATFLIGLHVVGQPRILARDPHDDHVAYVETLAS